MEHTGFEPVASTMPLWRAPSCANAPWADYNTKAADISRESEKKYVRKYVQTKKGPADGDLRRRPDRLAVGDLAFFGPERGYVPGSERRFYRRAFLDTGKARPGGKRTDPVLYRRHGLSGAQVRAFCRIFHFGPAGGGPFPRGMAAYGTEIFKSLDLRFSRGVRR